MRFKIALVLKPLSITWWVWSQLKLYYTAQIKHKVIIIIISTPSNWKFYIKNISAIAFTKKSMFTFREYINFVVCWIQEYL